MAAPKENLLPLGFLTSTERNTFTKQREHRLKKSRAMHLQQRWQELREREFTAQQHNRQLLQQFEEAQDTLREMLTLTAAMKTIRMEYERYLEESSPRWQQQLEERTQAALGKRMEEYLRSCVKNTEERVTESSADRPLYSQGPSTMSQKTAAPPKHYSQNHRMDYDKDGSPRLPYMQSSWQTPPQPQTARFPIRAPCQPQGSSQIPPSFLPHPHSVQLHPPASTPGHHHPRQSPPGWASLQLDYPWSWAAGAAGITSCSEALLGELHMEESPPETGLPREEADTSPAPSSKRERGGGGRSSHLSQELDIKPVRLSGGHAESSGSSRESSQVSREKKKRGRSQRSSSDRESCGSQESSRTSSAIVSAVAAVAQSSESDGSSDKGRTSTNRRTRRSGGLAVGSPRAEKVTKGNRGGDSGSHNEESQSTSEEVGSLIQESKSEEVANQSPDDKSESCGEESGSQREEESGSQREEESGSQREEESGSQREEESGSVSIKIDNGGGDEIDKQERSSSEQRDEDDPGDGEGQENDGDAEEKESNQTDEEQERDVEDDDDDDEASERNNTTDEEQERDVEDDDDDDQASERNNTTDEEEETGVEDEVEEKGDGEEEQPGRLKNEDGEDGKKGSASSQDEEVDGDESEGGEDNLEDGESDEEEQRRDEAGEPEEERDSDDSIILPQDKSKKMHITPEEASQEDDEEEEASKTGSSDDDSNEFSDDDVEHLLAPQEQSQEKEEKDLEADVKPKAICDNVEIFQVEPDKSTKSDHPSDSDEFDNFYG